MNKTGSRNPRLSKRMFIVHWFFQFWKVSFAQAPSLLGKKYLLIGAIVNALQFSIMGRMIYIKRRKEL